MSPSLSLPLPRSRSLSFSKIKKYFFKKQQQQGNLLVSLVRLVLGAARIFSIYTEACKGSPLMHTLLAGCVLENGSHVARGPHVRGAFQGGEGCRACPGASSPVTPRSRPLQHTPVLLPEVRVLRPAFAPRGGTPELLSNTF